MLYQRLIDRFQNHPWLTARVVELPLLVAGSLLAARPQPADAQAKGAGQPAAARCESEGFAPNFPLALRAGVPAIVYHVDGAWTCAGFQSGPRWVRSAELRGVPPDTTPRPAAWVGRWTMPAGTATIRRGSGDTLRIEGHAWWLGARGVSHSGSIRALAVLSRNRVHFVENLCVLDLALVGKDIVAGDNERCGGMNVRFWGIWRRSGSSSSTSPIRTPTPRYDSTGQGHRRQRPNER
jgi:hypothetical protein